MSEISATWRRGVRLAVEIIDTRKRQIGETGKTKRGHIRKRAQEDMTLLDRLAAEIWKVSEDNAPESYADAAAIPVPEPRP